MDAYRRVYERWGNSRYLRDKYGVMLFYMEVHDLVAAYEKHSTKPFSGKKATDPADAVIASWVAQTVMVQGCSGTSGEPILPTTTAIASDTNVAKLLGESYGKCQSDAERIACFSTAVLATVRSRVDDALSQLLQLTFNNVEGVVCTCGKKVGDLKLTFIIGLRLIVSELLPK